MLPGKKCYHGYLLSKDLMHIHYIQGLFFKDIGLQFNFFLYI